MALQHLILSGIAGLIAIFSFPQGLGPVEPNENGPLQGTWAFDPNDYFVSEKRFVWAEANTNCKKRFDGQGQLLSLNSERELQFVENNFLKSLKLAESHFWTSATYVRMSNEWKWFDGSTAKSFINFNVPNSNAFTPKTRLVLSYANGRSTIEPRDSTEPAHYICERIQIQPAEPFIIPQPLTPRSDIRVLNITDCTRGSDLMIVFDSSYEFTHSTKYLFAKNVASKLASEWKANSENRVGFATIQDDNSVTSIIRLDSDLPRNVIESRITAQDLYNLPSTRNKVSISRKAQAGTAMALNEAIDELRSENRGVPKTIVAIRGDKSRQAMSQSVKRRLEGFHIQLLEIEISKVDSQNEGRITVSGRNGLRRVFNLNANSYDQLVGYLTSVNANDCKA